MSVYSNVKPVISLLVVQNKIRPGTDSSQPVLLQKQLDLNYYFLLNFLLPEEYYQFHFIFLLETYLL